GSDRQCCREKCIMLSAWRQARPKAGAQRTLEGVACTPSLAGIALSGEEHFSFYLLTSLTVFFAGPAPDSARALPATPTPAVGVETPLSPAVAPQDPLVEADRPLRSSVPPVPRLVAVRLWSADRQNRNQRQATRACC